MTAERFQEIIARIEVTWFMKFDNLKREVYAEGIGDLNFDGAELAIKKLSQTLKFPPTIAEIREEYANIAHGDIPTLSDVLTAITTLLTQFGNWRYDESIRDAGREYIDSQPPIIKGLIRGMGWDNLSGCNWEFAQDRIKTWWKESAEELRVERQLSPKLVERIASVSGVLQASAVRLLTDSGGGEYGE